MAGQKCGCQLPTARFKRSSLLAQAHFIRRVAWAIVMSKPFDVTVLTLIVLNILLLAVQHKDENATWLEMTSIGNYIFTYSFCAELLLKLTALGPRKFWRDSWNRFDLVVVAGSVLDLNLKSVNIGARVRDLLDAAHSRLSEGLMGSLPKPSFQS